MEQPGSEGSQGRINLGSLGLSDINLGSFGFFDIIIRKLEFSDKTFGSLGFSGITSGLLLLHSGLRGDIWQIICKQSWSGSNIRHLSYL